MLLGNLTLASIVLQKKNSIFQSSSFNIFIPLKYPQIMQKKYQKISFGYRIQVALGVSTVFIDSLLGSGIAIDLESKGSARSL